MLNKTIRPLLVSLALITLVLAVFAQPQAVVARAHPTPTAPPTAPPPEAPSVHKIAIQQLVAWQAGIIDRHRYGTEFNAGVDDATLKKISLELGQKGAFVSSDYLGPVAVDGAPANVVSYMYRMICANGDVYERLSLQPNGIIAGVLFRDRLETPDPAESP